MTEQPTPTTLLSVRGEARLEVAPDLAEVAAWAKVAADTKAAALAEAKQAQDTVFDGLGRLGAVPTTVETRLSPLTVLTRSVGTYDEMVPSADRRYEVPSGRTIAHLSFELRIRDFDLLDSVAEVLDGQPSIRLGRVAWSVDYDNAAWAQVRSEAIAAAVQKGRDYAAALGGSVVSLDQLADAGLLDNRGRESEQESTLALSASGGSRPSLDVVPQQLRVRIEARFIATVAPLSAGRSGVPRGRPAGRYR